MAGWHKATLAILLAAAAVGAGAQGVVYTCIDEKGHRLTSDRLIAECTDREQKVIDRVGKVRIVSPPMTARERDAKAEEDRKLAEAKQKQSEERRAQRALVQRYPSQASHDVERGKALQAIAEATLNAQRLIEDLQKQRAKLKEEGEFYLKDPSRMPVKLKRQIEENDQQIAMQHGLIAGHDDEKKRTNARFDEELARLKPLWGQTGAVAAAAPAASGGAATVKR